MPRTVNRTERLKDIKKPERTPKAHRFINSGYDKESGVIARFIMPENGIITNLCLYAELTDNAKKVVVEIDVMSSRLSATVNIPIDKALSFERLNIPVQSRDVVTIRAQSPHNVQDTSVELTYEAGV